ncbi:MAG: FecR domain-containing protein [Pseudomonadota bacterium]
MDRKTLKLTLAAALAASVALPVFANEIGSVAAVNRDIEGTPPSAATRSLLLGDRLIANEKLVSSPLGSGQMLFLDQTSLTIAPNSEIVLDKYIYDPAADSGSLEVSLARGVLRVIGGRITKSSDGVVRTPTATIGIRGGIALVVAEGEEQTRVMHVAGEYTTVESGGQTLKLSRSNALATAKQGQAPEYNGVASEEEIAALYDQTQGGGGGSDEDLNNDVAEQSGLSAENSDEPNAVTDAPISTSGESVATDQSTEEELANLPSETEIQVAVVDEGLDEAADDVLNDDDQTDPDEPDLDPFATFVGGAVFSRSTDGFIDDDGVELADPVAQNYAFAGEGVTFVSIEEGSIIGRTADGQTVELPVSDSEGFFVVNAADTSTPEGPVSGFGFADPGSGFFFYGIENENGIGAALFGEPGPTQLTGLDNPGGDITATAFRILPDPLAGNPNEGRMPFLPPEAFDTFFSGGDPVELFFVTENGGLIFGDGTGQESFAGTKALLPIFKLQGAEANQSFYMSVGTTGVLNNGENAPTFSMFTRGSIRLPGDTLTSRIQHGIAPLGLSDSDTSNGITVFGSDDEYMLLGNEGPYLLNEDPTDEEIVFDFTSTLGEPNSFQSFAHTHVAQRQGTETVDFFDRFSVGTTFTDFIADTGLSNNFNLSDTDVSLLSGVYGSGSGYRASSDDMFLTRTVGEDSPHLGLGFFNRDPGIGGNSGGIMLLLDSVIDDETNELFGSVLHFGDAKSVVIDDARFGARENPFPEDFADGVGLDTLLRDTAFETTQGTLTGRAPNEFGNAAFRAALLSHGFADASEIYPAGTDLTPEFLTWGWWTGQFRFAEGDPGSFDNDRVQFSLGTWVGGDLTNNVPMTGIASFDGPVTVNVITGANGDFVDGGQFQMTYDFGQANGTATFTDVFDFDPIAVNVSAAAALGVNHYGGENALPGGGFGSVDGSFFDGPNANDARATAGTLFVDRPADGTVATGTFWGER